MPDQKEMIKVTVNGESRSCRLGATISDLLGELALPCDTVLVERNREVISREMFGEQQIREGDQLELICLMGGG